MLIIPAIDIIKGHCVRLSQGDYTRIKTYGMDPLLIAQKFINQGAGFLHVIDLDGAKSGFPVNSQKIIKIIKKINVPLQIGGGIRTYEDILMYLNNGAERVILGTSAIENIGLIKKIIKKYGNSKIIIAIDIKNDKLVINGWQKTNSIFIKRFLSEIKKVGVKTIVVTDTQKDGMLLGPNFPLIQKILNYGFESLVAGGVSKISDIQSLESMGVVGVIIGKALFEGLIDLEKAINDFSGY